MGRIRLTGAGDRGLCCAGEKEVSPTEKMPAGERKILVNPSWDELTAAEPLLKFSFYLSGRTNVLLDLGDEILELLDRGFAGNHVDGSCVGRASTLMWLWTLGAYEVVRTMTQARTCFSERVLSELAQIKKDLSDARMPAAKMEKRGKNQPVRSNRSPDGWDVEKRDLLLGDPEDERPISARGLLADFERVISGLTTADVLQPHESSYGGHKGAG